MSDPVSAVRTGSALLGAAWGPVRQVLRAREAHREIGEVVPKALALALCPDDPEHESARAAAAAIELLLHATPVPDSGRRQTRMTRLRARIGSLPVVSRRNVIPTVALFGETDFFVLLSRWLTDALKKADAQTRAAISEVGCRNAATHAPPTPEVLAVEFPAAFLQILAVAEGSTWRSSLLASLRAADENRESLRRQVDVTKLILGPTALAGLAAVTTTLAGATDHQTLIAALGAAGITVPAELVATWRNRSVAADPLRDAMHEAIREWLDDCREQWDLPIRDGAAPLSWIGDLRGRDELPIVPHHLLDHLARLRKATADHDENDLSVKMFRLEQCLLRLPSNPRVGREALGRLQEVALAVTGPPPPLTK